MPSNDATDGSASTASAGSRARGTPDLEEVGFFIEPASRTYVITYPAGRELCSSYVAGDPERFRRLLTEQVRVRELVETPVA